MFEFGAGLQGYGNGSDALYRAQPAQQAQAQQVQSPAQQQATMAQPSQQSLQDMFRHIQSLPAPTTPFQPPQPVQPMQRSPDAQPQYRMMPQQSPGIQQPAQQDTQYGMSADNRYATAPQQNMFSPAQQYQGMKQPPFQKILGDYRNLQKQGVDQQQLDAYLQSVGHTPDSFYNAMDQQQNTQSNYAPIMAYINR